MSISNVINDVITGIDGETVDPARLIGYGIVVLGALIWMTLTILVFVKSGTFDGVQFAAGITGISAALVAAAAGVYFKRSTEPDASTPTPTPVPVPVPTPVPVCVPTPMPGPTNPPSPTSILPNQYGVDTSKIPQNGNQVVAFIPQFSFAKDCPEPKSQITIQKSKRVRKK